VFHTRSARVTLIIDLCMRIRAPHKQARDDVILWPPPRVLSIIAYLVLRSLGIYTILRLYAPLRSVCTFGRFVTLSKTSIKTLIKSVTKGGLNLPGHCD
jgi:hypothetical protein